ncbi:MAG: YfcE family phosphodiesterase [Gammaproteobacteria bacterium]|jgi:putative phosphoesterase
MQKDTIDASTIGILADTHDDICPWEQVLEKIRSALDGVDAIIHCGDICSAKAIEDLAAIAPVYAVRSGMDPTASPPTLVDGPRVLVTPTATLGVVNALDAEALDLKLGSSIEFGSVSADAVCERLFEEGVDVLIFGGTHVACLADQGGKVFINPGSPSLAETTSLARLTLTQGGIIPELVTLA